MTVIEILEPRFSKLELKGFKAGYLDESKTKLFAYTLLPVNDPDYEDLQHFYLHNKGYSSVNKNMDEEIYRIYTAEGSYMYKDVKQLVKEDIFKYVSLRFHGSYYQDIWYIIEECCYFEDDDEQNILKDIEAQSDKYGMWLSSHFTTIEEYEERIDLQKIFSNLSDKLGKPISMAKNEQEICEYINTLDRNLFPKLRQRQYCAYREFIGMPWLVAYLKQESKEKINRSFESYMNEALFIPFLNILKIARPEEFYKMETLYHQYYFSLIYPHSKQQIICVVKAINKQETSRLYYFLYIALTSQLFEWTLPIPRPLGGHYSLYILEDIKTLSEWGEEFDLHDSSITMDDPNFWNDYVFKKENEEYLYLKPIAYQNLQKDMYNLL